MDFALFLLIILVFYNSGKFLTHKLWSLRFTGPGEAILFPVALGSIVISGIMTALLFLGWTKPETCWVVLGVLLLLGWKNLLYLTNAVASFHFFKAYYHYASLLDKGGKKDEAISHMKSIIGSSKDLPDYKLEKERYWIDEAYKFLRKNGVELA